MTVAIYARKSTDQLSYDLPPATQDALRQGLSEMGLQPRARNTGTANGQMDPFQIIGDTDLAVIATAHHKRGKKEQANRYQTFLHRAPFRLSALHSQPTVAIESEDAGMLVCSKARKRMPQKILSTHTPLCLLAS